MDDNLPFGFINPIDYSTMATSALRITGDFFFGGVFFSFGFVEDDFSNGRITRGLQAGNASVMGVLVTPVEVTIITIVI